MLLAVVFLAAVFVVLQTTTAKADEEKEYVINLSEAVDADYVGSVIISVDADGKQIVSVDGVEETVSGRIVITCDEEDYEYGVVSLILVEAAKGTSASIVLRGVAINNSPYEEVQEGDTFAPITVSGEGTVTIELDGESLLAAPDYHAGIEKKDTGTLVISDVDQNGILRVWGGAFAAGIGSAAGIAPDLEEFDQVDVSDVTITGGEIFASGGYYGAGIGGGYLGCADNITISGGYVCACSGFSGAGIGGGAGGEASNIIIKNDAIVAASGGGYDEGYGQGAAIGFGGQEFDSEVGESAFDGEGKPVKEIIDISGLYDVGAIALYPAMFLVQEDDNYGDVLEYMFQDFMNNRKSGDNTVTGFEIYADWEDREYSAKMIHGSITTYNLWVGGTLVSERNCDNILPADGYVSCSGKASFDPKTNTLTLDNYQYKGTGHRTKYSVNEWEWRNYYEDADSYAAISYGYEVLCVVSEVSADDDGSMPNETLTIVLKGDNSVEQTGNCTKSCGIEVGNEIPSFLYELFETVIIDEPRPQAYVPDEIDGKEYGIHLLITGGEAGSLKVKAGDVTPTVVEQRHVEGTTAGPQTIGGYSRGIAVNMGKLMIDGVSVEAEGGNTSGKIDFNPYYRIDSWRYTEGAYCAFGLCVKDGELIAMGGDASDGWTLSSGIDTGSNCDIISGVVKAYAGQAEMTVIPTVANEDPANFGGSCGILMSYDAYMLRMVFRANDSDENYEEPIVYIGSDITTVLFAGYDAATDMKVVNEVAGKGWFTYDGNDDVNEIVINKDKAVSCGIFTINDDGLEDGAWFLRAEFHQHQFDYSASGNTITAGCADEDCEKQNLTLTISAPAEDKLVYDGTAKAATLNEYDKEAFDGAGPIVYTKDGKEVSADKVVDAGKYKATVSIKVGDTTYTAEVEFEITPKEVTEDDLKTFGTALPTGLTGVYGQKLSEIALPEATEGDNGGTWAWIKSDTVIGPVGDQTYEATFTPNNTNYAAGTFKITVKVLPKDAKVTAADASKTYGAKDPELTATVEGLVGEDTIKYTLSREAGEDVKTYAITASGEKTQGNYTVTFVNGTFTIEKAKAPEKLNDDEQPKANDLSENDKDQPLVTAPGKLPNGYTKIQYSDDGGKTWKDTIPTGKAPGEYNIQVRYIGDGNHEDFTGTPIKVTIKAVYTVIWLNPDGTEFVKKTYGDGETEPKLDSVPSKADDDTYKYIFLEWEKASEVGHTKTYKPVYAAIPKNLYIIEGTFEWTKGSDDNIIITVKRTVDDQTCFSHFKAVRIGDTVIVLGEDYDAKSGSTVITLKASTLNKLDPGDYPITIIFDDGEAKATLSILEAEATPTPTATPAVDPNPEKPDSAKTGDTSTLWIWMMLAIASAGTAGGVYANRRLRRAR